MRGDKQANPGLIKTFNDISQNNSENASIFTLEQAARSYVYLVNLAFMFQYAYLIRKPAKQDHK